jgi:hypothetical protein
MEGEGYKEIDLSKHFPQYEDVPSVFLCVSSIITFNSRS